MKHGDEYSNYHYSPRLQRIINIYKLSDNRTPSGKVSICKVVSCHYCKMGVNARHCFVSTTAKWEFMPAIVSLSTSREVDHVHYPEIANQSD